jgi:IclR helix-turn-helix domain
MNSAEENLEKTVMHNQNWPEKQRVWACLKLHTAALTQEIATKIERSQCGWAPTAVPLRQADIAREIGIPLKSVHRCVVDLEREGWLLRETVAAGVGGTELQIHCYALPRKPKAGEANPSTAPARPVYDGLPEELAYWLRRLKLPIPKGENIERARLVAVGLSEQVNDLRDLCKPKG